MEGSACYISRKFFVKSGDCGYSFLLKKPPVFWPKEFNTKGAQKALKPQNQDYLLLNNQKFI
jgi:hypothetical protein